MNPDMQTRKRAASPDFRHHMFVKVVPFNLAMYALGCENEQAIARVLGVDAKTVNRVRRGEVTGEVFMANAIATFRLNADKLARVGLKPTLDEFFEARESAPVEVSA